MGYLPNDRQADVESRRTEVAYDFRRPFGLGERSGLAASLANRSALSRSRFFRSATCSFSCSVKGLSDGRNMLLASSRLLMA